MAYKYAHQKDMQVAKAVGTNLDISVKHAGEIGRAIKNQKVSRARAILQEAVALKNPIAFTRFNGDVGHKSGNMGAGRFAPKACAKILKILNSAEHNAVDLGMTKSNLVVQSVVPNKAAGRPKYGRQRGRMSKNTHVELILTEVKSAKSTTTKSIPKTAAEPATKSATKPTVKTAAKPTAKTATKPKAETKPAAKTAEKPAPKTEATQ